MSEFLCISIRFLDREFHGRNESGEAEWPPSPLRLFEALIAAAAAKNRSSGGVIACRTMLVQKMSRLPALDTRAACP